MKTKTEIMRLMFKKFAVTLIVVALVVIGFNIVIFTSIDGNLRLWTMLLFNLSLVIGTIWQLKSKEK